jgi:hypothetical protein
VLGGVGVLVGAGVTGGLGALGVFFLSVSTFFSWNF